MRTVAIVGSSLAGLRAAETFRREGFDGRIVAIGAEAHLPYDRPPLSKEFLRGDWEPEQLVLRKQGVDDLDLEWRLDARAIALDIGAREVELHDGERVAFDGLVIACGATPRRLANQPNLAGLFTLRTLDDALALLGVSAPKDRPIPNLPEHERRIWDALDGGFVEMDALATKCGLSTPECLSAITSLEIMGLIDCSPAGEIRRR